MRKFIAYFDFLGFKQFIQFNDEEYLQRRAKHILRDIELALSHGKTKYQSSGLLVPDMSESKINCLNISDTVIFWTNSVSSDDLEQLIQVAFRFNWQENLYNFPVRGCIIYDHINILSGNYINVHSTIYRPNLVFGKGLLNAHLKCDQLNWAGTVIDESVIFKDRNEINSISIVEKYAKMYSVPYKNKHLDEYALYLGKPISDNLDALEIRKQKVFNVFKSDNKSMSETVKIKLENTIKFIESDYFDSN